MSGFGFRFQQDAVRELLNMGGLFVRTRQVLRDHVESEGQLPTDEVEYLAGRTLPYVEAMQEGFRYTVRAVEAGVDELRYVVSPYPLAEGEDDQSSGADARRQRLLEQPEMACVAALLYGRVVMGMLPRVPPQLTTFPDGLPYRDIWPPRGPGELKDRLEELERGLWEIATGRPREAIYHGRYRRLYGFFEAGAWLGLEQARLLGKLPS